MKNCAMKFDAPSIMITECRSDEELCDEVWRAKHHDHRVEHDALPAQLPGPLHAGHVHHHLGGGDSGDVHSKGKYNSYDGYYYNAENDANRQCKYMMVMMMVIMVMIVMVMAIMKYKDESFATDR